MLVRYEKVDEAKNKLSTTETYLIPGYTGHCPTLKFRFGKRYAVNTKEIIQDLSKYRISNYDLKILDNCQHHSIVENFSVLNTRTKQLNNKRGNDGATHQHRKYILGYTGYIPGMYFRFGKSFSTLADECEKQLLNERNLHRNRNGHTKMVNDKRKVFDDTIQWNNNFDKCKYGEVVGNNKICSQYSPIKGYTGHIPTKKVSTLSISRPYRDAVKLGLPKAKQKESPCH